MKKTSQICEKTSPTGFQTREPVECIGGAVMEIISGGGHDHGKWQKQRTAYLVSSKPLALCMSDAIPIQARSWCFIYLTPYLFEASGMDPGNPSPDYFEKAFRFCDALPIADEPDRASCYGGFGKEFVVLAQNRDIRAIADMNSEQLATVYSWCQLVGERKARGACVVNAIQSLFWGGENDPKGAILFCKGISDESDRHYCFDQLIGAVASYKSDTRYREQFCGNVPGDEQEQCRTALLRVQ